MKEFEADLHIHTCLSPCGESEMTPRLIVKEARKKGLDVIGICDHNSSDNALSVKKVARMEGLKVLGGIEISTREEVHILALFDDDESLMILQRIVYDSLPGENDEKAFGEQLILNEEDELSGRNNRLLIGATELPIERAVGFSNSLGGLVIASDVDRESFSIISQLGFVPRGLEIHAVEVSSPRVGTFVLPRRGSGISKKADTTLKDSNRRANGTLNDVPVVSFSDAHCLRDIGKSTTTFFLEQPSVLEIKKAFCGLDGRKLRI